jgi:hypothetical protein
VRLLVHPRLGPLESDAVGRAFLDAVGTGGGAERVMALAWREGNVLTVERRAPMTTAAGKILHLHARSRREPPLNGTGPSSATRGSIRR